MTAVTGSLDRLQKKDKISAADKESALKRIRGTTRYDDLAACDLVIEAATENEELKVKILKQVDGLARPDVIIATNTSSISITRLAAATSRPGKLLGMHFFNPVPMMPLVEVIRGHLTDDGTVDAVTAFAKALGKTPIVVRNSPGFVVNRILCPMLNEAILALQEGLASPEDIDNGMKLGCSHPIGPLALCDHGGPRRAARGDGGVLPRLQRSQVPARAAAEGDGGGGTSRAQVRSRLLHVFLIRAEHDRAATGNRRIATGASRHSDRERSRAAARV
jgi:3-hydroxybutyryl-CoA dehydrogenase